MKRQYVDTPEGQVHFVTAGSGDPLLLMAHTPRSWTYFRQLIPQLAVRRRVIVMDTLGFGSSDDAPRDARIPYFGQSVVHFLDALGIDRADIWGTVTGGVIALDVAATRPERVHRLLLMELPFFTSEEERKARVEDYRVQMPGSPKEDGSHVAAAWQMALGGYDGPLNEVGVQTVTDYATDIIKAGTKWPEMAIRVHSYEKAPRLAKVQSPTLVIGLDELSPHPYLKRAAEVQALLPDSRLEMIQGGLLSVTYGGKADKLAHTVLGFLDE